MARCEVCHKVDDERAFEVVMNASRHTFDTFQCAIDALAPVCETCGSRIVGHGVREENHLYCGAHCALLKNAAILARFID
ncbi:MAG: hypothetical protein E6G39_15455 [Actinobacteria bacterium]|nr:MAG: hypothetical protein E6G39_15455 [Actinomycetota bacterium]